MSRTRTTPDSPRKTTDPKRRSFDKDHSPYALFSSVAPLEPLCVGILSPIDLLIDDMSIKRLAGILVNSDELVDKAKAAKVILEDGISNPEQGVEKLSNVVHEFWRSQCFVNGLCTRKDLVAPVAQYANEDSAHQRWKLMKEDPLFKPSLTSLDSPAATNSDIMRFFVSILIGYWGDRAVLTNLDDTVGKAFFGSWLTFVAREREREKGKQVLYVEKREIKNFIYLIKDAEDAKKNLKLVQEWLVSTYGNDKNVNTDAFLEEIQSEISRNLEMSRYYDGKKAKFLIQVVDGHHAFVRMDSMCKM